MTHRCFRWVLSNKERDVNAAWVLIRSIMSSFCISNPITVKPSKDSVLPYSLFFISEGDENKRAF